MRLEDALCKMRFAARTLKGTSCRANISWLAARTLGSTRYGGFYVLPEAKIAQNTRISGQVVHETGFLCTTFKVAACKVTCKVAACKVTCKVASSKVTCKVASSKVACKVGSSQLFGDTTQIAPPDFLSRFLV